MAWAAVALLALVPGAVGWLWGRAILRRRHEPALAERLKRRLTHVLALAWTELIGFWLLGFGPIPGVLALLGVVVSGFPLRRALLDESWGLAGYLWFQTRAFVAFAGFWLLLGVGPGLARSGGSPAAAALTLGTVLVAWNVGYGWLFRRLLAGRPFTAHEEDRLGAHLERIDARSPVSAVHRLVIPLRGGRFANAFALPGRRPAVLVSQTLVEELEPPEVAAIYAHEVAHLERFDAQRLRRRALLVWGLVAAAVALPFAPLPSWVLLVVWPAALIVFFLALRPQQEEHASDLRAAELCGDPGAVERALVKIHAMNLQPRRQDPEEGGYQTHPSLSRRIRALRREAGSEAAGPAAPAPGAEAPARAEAVTAFPGAQRGRFVLLGEEQAAWLEDVPEGTPDDPESLRRGAGSLRAVAYRNLSELRLEPGKLGRPPVLVAREGSGRPWRTPVAPDGAAALERVLDRVDPHVGDHPVGGRAWARPLAALALLASLVPPVAASAAFLAVAALAFPGPTTLAAAGAGGLLAALWSWRGPGTSLPLELPEAVAWLTSAGLALAAALLLATGLRWARHERRGLRRTGWRMAAWLLPFSALVWLPLVFGGLDPFSLHHWVRAGPGTFVFPAAVAAVLWLAGGRGERLLAVVAAAAAVLSLGVGSAAFRTYGLEDPLLLAGPPRHPERLTPALVQEAPAAYGTALRTSPTGRTFAVQSWDDLGGAAWELYRVGDAEPLARLDALDVALPRDGEVLVLSQPRGTGERTVLASRPLAPGAEGGWRLGLPLLEAPSLTAAGDAWEVYGTERSGDTAVFRRFAGTVDGQIRSRLRLTLGPSDGERWTGAAWTPLGDGTALAVTVEWPEGPAGLPLGGWGVGGSRQRTRLWRVRYDGAAPLAESRLPVTCAPAAGAALCSADDGEWCHLWIVPAEGPPRPLGAVRERYLDLMEVRAGRALLGGFAGMRPVVATVDGGPLRLGELVFDEAATFLDARLLGPDRLAALTMTDDDATFGLYELAALADQAIAPIPGVTTAATATRR